MLGIQKLNPDRYKYATWLWEEQVKYANARHYYTVWGARGTGIDRGHTYDLILVLIQEEIELCQTASQAHTVTSVPKQDSVIGKPTF